jgi:glutamate racemase
MSAPPVRIGVFDSGFGGLTVLRALLQYLPDAEFVYLGDSARLPYGSKSRETVTRYAVESARLLESDGAQYLVIACNTASALALDAIRESVRVPVLGVIETGADSAAAVSVSRDVLVLATDATVQSHAYGAACAERGMRALEQACPLLVPLIEEGWTTANPDPERVAVTRRVLQLYLEEAAGRAADAGMTPDTLLLGCTHYPLLQDMLSSLAPANMRILDSAQTTARRVQRELGAPTTAPSATSRPSRRCRFLATDSVEKFQSLASRFLGQPIREVEHIDLGG